MQFTLLFAIAAGIGVVTTFGCIHSKAGESAEARADLITTTTTPPADGHLLVLVSYENGAFKAEKVRRVLGPVHEVEGVPSRGGLRFVARSGATSVLLGGARDVRMEHYETTDSTGQMHHVRRGAVGRRSMLIHVPSSVDNIDFYDTSAAQTMNDSLATTASGSSEELRSAPSSSPLDAKLGSVSLKGLL